MEWLLLTYLFFIHLLDAFEADLTKPTDLWLFDRLAHHILFKDGSILFFLIELCFMVRFNVLKHIVSFLLR